MGNQKICAHATLTIRLPRLHLALKLTHWKTRKTHDNGRNFEIYRIRNACYDWYWLCNFHILWEKTVINFFSSIIFETIAEREKKNIVRPDMINILMQVRQGNALQVIADGTGTDEFGLFSAKRALKRKWSDNELLAQCLLFFTAIWISTVQFIKKFTKSLEIRTEAH